MWKYWTVNFSLHCFLFFLFFLKHMPFLFYPIWIFFLEERISTCLPLNCHGAHYLRRDKQWHGIIKLTSWWQAGNLSNPCFLIWPLTKHISFCYMDGISSPGCSVFLYPGWGSDFYSIVFKTMFARKKMWSFILLNEDKILPVQILVRWQ